MHTSGIEAITQWTLTISTMTIRFTDVYKMGQIVGFCILFFLQFSIIKPKQTGLICELLS